MHLREAMETSSAGSGTGRKKLKHRLAAILSAFSRRAGGARKRRESEEKEATPSPPIAFPSYSRLGVGNGSSSRKHGIGGLFEPRRFSVSAPRPTPLVHITIDCAGRRSVDAADPSVLPHPLDADAASRKTRLTGTGPPTSGEWEGRKCPPSSPFVALLPPLPPPPVARWRERERANNGSSSSSRRRLSTHSSSRRLAWSSSSDDEYEYEYDEEGDSRNNLFSSRSFSSDSCSNLYNNRPKAQARASISGPCRAPPPPPAPRRGASRSCRYSFELPRGTSSDGGFAVVKRSADPYEDFRKSMREMIAEWPPAAGGSETERLLETYLVLNSPRHYPAILAAFADVRETLFP